MDYLDLGEEPDDSVGTRDQVLRSLFSAVPFSASVIVLLSPP